MKVENWSIDKVEPYDKNPRNNDDAVEATANSIKEFGWQQPIVVDKDGVIIAGHTRLKAAKKLSLKEVPVTVAKDLTDEQVKAYRLADNKSGELAGWDIPQLEDELSDIELINMKDFGFDTDDVDIDDLFEDDDQLDDQPIDTAEKLTWSGHSIEISQSDIDKLDKLYDQWQESSDTKTFVQWLNHE